MVQLPLVDVARASRQTAWLCAPWAAEPPSLVMRTDIMDEQNNTAFKVTLTRNLRLFDITMIGVGPMTRAGIFVLPGLAAGQAGPALLLAFFLNGLVALFTVINHRGAAETGHIGSFLTLSNVAIPVEGIVRESEKRDLLFIGATGEGLFEQRLLGSIPERVAREAPRTVTMTKRCRRLKSLLGRVGGYH